MKLASIAGAVALLAGATYAQFTSNTVKIEGVTLASATPALQIYDGSAWQTGSVDLNIHETNMYPSWEGSEHTFYLRNKTGGGVPFGSIIANLPSATSDWEALKNVVQMRFGETGVNWSTNWYTLNDWNSGSANVLLSDLPDDTQRQFSVQFRMPSGDDSAKGKNLTIVLGFVAETP